MKTLFFFLLWALPLVAMAQSGSVVISQTVPVSVNVCDSAQFIIKVQNITGNTLTNLKLNIAMPGGVNYIPGSVSSIPAGVVQFNISNLQNPVFTIPFMFAYNSVFILIYSKVDCGIITYQQQGNPIINTAKITYPNSSTDQNISTTYNVNAPVLVITSFTNQSYTGAVGTTFTRSITIKNSGTGSLSSFTLTDAHGTEIDVLSAAPGVLSGTTTNDTVSVSGTNFTAIGDGDNLFENGESITIIETVKIIACIQPGVPSTIKVYWGCGNQTACQTASTTANVAVTPVGTPNLVITPTESFETCLNPLVARKQYLKIVNIGAGSANHIAMDIYQGAFTIPNSGYQNRIDETSFTYKVGINGNSSAITVDSSRNNAPFSCLGSNPKYRVYLRLPVVINPIVDTVYLKWNSYACCQVNSCDSAFVTAVAPWEFKGKYTDACDSTTTYDIFPTSGGNVYGRYLNTSMTPEDMPTDISGNTTTTFEHSATNWQNKLDSSPGAYYQVQITIPPCFLLATTPNPVRFRYNPNGTIWLPTSPLTQSGNVVTARFATPDPFGINGLSQASLLFDLISDCSICADPLRWNQNISVKIDYNPNPGCTPSCMLKVYCNTSAVNLHCGGPCPRGGLTPLNYKMLRTSYGQPDNNNDGLPEVGIVNLNAIKTKRAMFGDTLTGFFRGIVEPSNVHPSFAYAYASATINNLGTYLSFIDAKVVIYDMSTATRYTCGSVPPISAAPSGSNFKTLFDISPGYLITNGCALPGGFVFQNGDSVFVNHRYKVIANTGGPVVQSNSTTDFYSSAVPNPPPNPVPANKFTCTNFSGNYLSLYGFFFKADTSETSVTKACNAPSIRNSNFMSIGPCCQNYGSNKFPFEYRKWANIDTIKVMIPFGYDYVSATVSGLGQITQAISPLNPSSDTLLFYIGALYPSPWLDYSFDGYENAIQVTLIPTCNVANSVLKPILYEDTHKKVAFIGGGNAVVNFTADHIAYNTSPQITLQSTLQTVSGINSIESWDVTLCNTSNNANANNTWLSFVSPNSNISIVDVTDVTTSLIITPVGGIYKLGTRPFNTCNKYHIRFTYTTCALDSLIVNAGWNCSGYPDSLSKYPCVPIKYPVYVDPKPAALQMQISGPVRDTIALCDTTSYEVVLNSVLLASVYNIVLTAALPTGTTVEPGTSEVIYPKTPAVWAPLANPTISGQNNSWNLSSLVPLIGTNGLPGVNSPNLDQVRVRFKIRPDCNFICGSTVPFSTTSKNVCGQALPTQHATSGALYIQGVQALNQTSMTVTVDTIRACGNGSLVTVNIVNLGPGATSGNEHFNFPASYGTSYVSGSFSGIHNPPSNGTPTVIVLNGQNYLDWQFPVGIAPLDYTSFTFLITVNPDSVKCSTITFPVKTTGSFSAVCITNNTVCIIRSITSAADIAVSVSKPCLSVTTIAASSTPAGNGENINLGYTVFNSCNDKAAGYPVTVYFYFDNDNNGVHSTGDTLIGSNTTTGAILSNTGSTYTGISFFSNTAPSCSILAVIDTSANACTCANSVIAANLPLLNAGVDSVFCSGDSLVIGLTSTTGYTYVWSPVTGLSNPTSASTAVTLTNNTLSPITLAYTLTTNRGGCTSSDTVQVKINPFPTATATPVSQTFCSGDSTAITLSSNVGGTSFSWTVSQTGVTGATADTGAAIVQTLTTIGTVAGTAVYAATPSAQGCPGNPVIITITVNPVDSSASFNYSSGTYCQSGTNPSPIIIGIPGGTFSSAPIGLSLNPSTGTINLSTSALDTYTVTYTTSGICPNTSSISMTITNVTPSAAFSYFGSPFCPGGSNPSPVFGPGASAGIFSATPAGLVFVNANTGQIDLTLSIPGIYTVINTIPASGSCLAASATTTITIARDDASFVYSSATYCQSGSNPTPSITGLPGGIFSSTPVGLSLNPSTGTINLATSTLGVYILCYLTNGACPNTSCITMTITNTTPSANFSYPNASYCQNGINPSPVYGQGASAGIFSASPAGLDFMHLNTGEINLALSTPGTYIVTNTIPISGSCLAASDTTTVVITIMDNASFNYTSGTYCTSGANPTPVITGLAGGSFSSSPAGLSIISSTGTINLGTSALGVYTLTYTTSGTCPNTSSITMTITNVTPSAVFSYPGSPFCPNGGNNPFPIFGAGASAGTFSATPAGLVFVNVNTGEINLALSTPGTYTITNTIPASGTCLAAIATTTITIAKDDASFAYTSTIYCQSGANPTPIITGLPGGTFSFTPSGSGLSLNPSTGTINLSTSVLGTYIITYTTNGACPNSDSITMTIGNTAPVASFTANPTTGETPLTVNFINSSTNASSYLWQFGTGDTSTFSNPTYTYVPLGAYTVCLMAYNVGGCVDTACATIDVYINSAMMIPNVFTPNGDGVNDVFTIRTKGLKSLDVTILNRWGQQIYEWQTLSGGWDGYSASGVPLSDGTYFYIINAKGLDEKKYSEKGHFSLIRDK